jgi:RNA polymerase sigma-70 factor, ECF subfamily
MSNYSDEQLIGGYLRNKDEKILEELIKRYLPVIFGFVKKYIGDKDIAADITQEVFVKVWKNLKRFDQSKSFRTWIFTIAKRTAIDELRKKSVLPFSVFGEDNSFLESLADESISIVDQVFLRQKNRELAVAMSKLPTNYSAVIKMYNTGSFNFREIAAELKEPLNTIKSRYRRGLTLLRKILKG